MLEGDLGDFTLPDILNLLAFTSKSGRLALVADDARGRVEFTDGRVRDASADANRLPLARRLLGRGLVDGATLRSLLGERDALPTDQQLARELIAREHVASSDIADVLREQTFDAVFDLLRWSTGTFRFDASPPDLSSGPDDERTLSVEELLAETERRLAAWTDIRERTGPGDTVVTVGRPSGSVVEVDADGWQLIGLADGQRTLDELAVLCGRGQFDTRSTLASLLDLGVVAIGEHGGGVEALLADQALLSDLEVRLGGTPSPTGRATESVDDMEADADHGREAAATSSSGEDASWVKELKASETAGADPDTAAPSRTPSPAPQPAMAGAGTGSNPLRAARRTDRLRTDPTVDANLVSRLIDGVEEL